MPTMTVRMSEGMKAEIETIVPEVGLWQYQSEFVREALDEYIKKFWKGPRFCKKPQLRC